MKVPKTLEEIFSTALIMAVCRVEFDYEPVESTGWIMMVVIIR